MGADWSIGVGVLVYFIALIIAIILYILYRKYSLVVYIASISTLIFSIFYTIDVYSFSRNLILLTLIIATVAFFALGWYFKGIEYKRNI